MRALQKMPSGSLSASCAYAPRPAPSLAGIRCQQDRSLSDAVGYVHGGKYQFDETYNVAHQFTSGGEITAQVVAGNTMNLSELVKPETDMLQGTLVLTPSRSLAAVSIVNEEMSWERFVVRLVGGDGADTAADVAVTVTPESGDLAPRGGANNVCDPSKPYKDSAPITLSLSRHGVGYLQYIAGGGEDELKEKPLYMMVKTELVTRTWLVRLVPDA